MRVGLEGGNLNSIMRAPKLRGFKNPFRVEYQVVNLDRLAELYPSGGDVTIGDLVAKGAVRKNEKVKVLGSGDIAVKLNVAVDKVSSSAERRSSRPAAPSSSHRDGGPTGATSSAVIRRPAPTIQPEASVFSAVARIFRTPDLRRKIGFTLGIIALFRLGSFIPAPFVDFSNVQTCLQGLSGSSGSLYDLVNLFSGGALLKLSIFALGIMPYITASIIVQLLRVVIPHFDALYKEGQAGQAKLTQYTRYLTIALGVLQSTTLITVARSGALFSSSSQAECSQLIDPAGDTWYGIILMVITMTAGTGVIMWFGELITERGIGNGMSLMIFTSIAAQFPNSLGIIAATKGIEILLVVIAIGLLVVVAVIFVEQSQRRIPVQYAKRMVGRRTYGGNNTYIPIKVNMAGVVPVIFASSLLYLPALIAQFNQPRGRQGAGTVGRVDHQLPHQGRSPALHAAVLPAHRRVHLLLRRHHVQPGRGRRQHEEVRRVHPRHPCRASDRRVPRLRAHPDHAAGFDVPGLRGAHPA